MIMDKLENIESYTGISKPLDTGLRFLKSADFSAMPDGKYFLDENGVFYMVQSYETKEKNDTPEAHRKYIDIQYIVSGEEIIGAGNLNEMAEEVSANPEGDIWFYHGPLSYTTLKSGWFGVYFPQDAHAPCIAVNGCAPVKKIVVKVPVSFGK